MSLHKDVQILYSVSHLLPNRLAGGPLLRVATIRRTTDTFLFISHTTNVLLFKFRCNIFIGVRIIKEMPGSVASGTHCTIAKSSENTVATVVELILFVARFLITYIRSSLAATVRV